MQLPPLSLYIHIPWCVQKCPYCDFNSHALKYGIPEQEYVSHLIDDLTVDLKWVQGRQLHSIFIGGGTPSLLSETAIARLLAEVQNRIEFAPDIEITLEANPGTLEYNKFSGFSDAGVNRISIGVQSFQADKLEALGRIHSPDEAEKAARFATSTVPTFNLDLMHGLPDQTLDDALGDLANAIDLSPTHLSWYQLTIEPNTLFYFRPPTLPEDDILWTIQEEGQKLIADAGYRQYEISAYAKPGFECKHNLNYWRFGDYLGIGCGAHGKITNLPNGNIVRTEKVKHPKGYMDLTQPYLKKQWTVPEDDLPFEYFMNKLRLFEPFDLADFSQFTGLDASSIDVPLQQAIAKGLISANRPNIFSITPHGHLFYNDLLDLFLA
ncbi:radical SAM family heme chaperone HemW [Psychrosphaera sp. B3R10]|uniref:radical SAM family heme chaperone HemW n=1 Tax=unclassified Psychrosphaera TaxID=2641570 RepID=UPI001C0908AA|nr:MULTISPECIES: radical SAM family heme chaperone HemW [unclassified Psychrosphaera]MBU2882099.1 radical SAM family heme chaperone HemW [Psychrosphaera sp. I2R16]MBU2990187.1 radical SAM family heme chaperone HemW [Psychrosphaera sp. B3R10]